MQTLRSVLFYTFNKRIAYFDLLFDSTKEESDATGFQFEDIGVVKPANFLKLTTLSGKHQDNKEKTKLRSLIIKQLILTEDQEDLIETNLNNLWDVFVDTKIASIAYFTVSANDESIANEVFRRLNTGGVQLNQIELVLGKIKAHYSDYEEKLWSVSEEIKRKSGGGIDFSSDQIVQFFHLLTKGTTRIDASRFVGDDVETFHKILNNDLSALIEVFEGYFFGLFKINNENIIPRWLAVLPIIVYITSLKQSGHVWQIKKMTLASIQNIDKYFILSQFCDWNTQTMVNSFSLLAKESGANNELFPIDKISVLAGKKRKINLQEDQFLSCLWLAIKILSPGRSYSFHANKPQIDHIFPLNLSGQDENYKNLVDVIWNFQPMPAGINNYKRAKNPRDFFLSEEGSKYWKDYDFIPEPTSAEWNDVNEFITSRKKRMIDEIQTRYGLSLEITNSTSNDVGS